MSQENVEIARALYPANTDLVAIFAHPEALDQLRAFMHPDLEAVFEARSISMGPAGIEETGETGKPTVHGFDALVTSWREWLSAWDTWVITPTDFLDVDEERVLVLMGVRARSKTHQVEMELEGGANLLNIRDGKVARLELFLDQNDALEAAGLSE